MKNKRGQFYLIAALVIIVIIGGFITLFFDNMQDSPTKIYDLKEELGIESENVLDYGTYNDYNSEQKNELIENFSKDYDDYRGQEKDIFFVYGNEDEINVLTYNKTAQGRVGAGVSSLDIDERRGKKKTHNNPGQDIKIKISEGITRDVDISEGENFYFIISEDTGDEKYIIESRDNSKKGNEVEEDENGEEDGENNNRNNNNGKNN